MKNNLKRNKNMTYDQKRNCFGTPRGEITGKPVFDFLILHFFLNRFVSSSLNLVEIEAMKSSSRVFE